MLKKIRQRAKVFLSFPFSFSLCIFLRQREREKETDFYLAYSNKCKMIGVEYDKRLYNTALENHKRAISAHRVEFINSCASEFKALDDVTCAYFFNPFSVEILKKVIDNLCESINKNNREIKLFFYYPSKEYLAYLNDHMSITHIEDIDCNDLFKHVDYRERIAVYRIN